MSGFGIKNSTDTFGGFGSHPVVRPIVGGPHCFFAGLLITDSTPAYLNRMCKCFEVPVHSSELAKLLLRAPWFGLTHFRNLQFQFDALVI